MLLDPGCIPCIINQAYNTARMLTTDKEIQSSILKEVCGLTININGGNPAPFYSRMLQTIFETKTGKTDIYEGIKKTNLAVAGKYLNYLRTMMGEATDKIEMGVRISIIGNTIDIAANPNFNLLQEINTITSDNIILDKLPQFKEDIKHARRILFIADNYEESVFDKIFIETLSGKDVVFAVRSKSIYNDITYEDALGLGIDKLCSVIKSGSEIAGTDLHSATGEFRKLFQNADVVIAKGQGNYETLMNAARPIYFMFKVKCEPISARCGYPVGSGVLYLKK